MENDNKKKWRDLTFRNKAAYAFAIVSFGLGWLITFIAFYVSGFVTVADPILFILMQSLLFTGSVIGFAQFAHGQITQFKEEIRNELNR